MRATFALLLLLVTLVACNHESPTNVAGRNDYSQIVVESKKGESPNVMIYSVFVPAPWCPATKADSISPWFEYFINGQRFFHQLTNADIQAAVPGREDYYRIDFWADRSSLFRVLLRFGNHRNGNDPDHDSRANLNRDNPRVVFYQPTTNRADDEHLLGFVFVEGAVYPFDNNALVPIRATIHFDDKPKAKQGVHFWLSDYDYSRDIGIKSVVWEFSDGYRRFGEDVIHIFDRPGRQSCMVIITDNLGKTLKLEAVFDVL